MRTFLFLFGMLAAGLCLGPSRASAGIRYMRINGNTGFTVGHTKVINFNPVTGFVSPKFDDILITDFSFRIVPHDIQPLTWSVQVQERRGSCIDRINAPGSEIPSTGFQARTASITSFRPIGTTQANKEFLCGISFPHNGVRCFGWVHLRAEYTHPLEPPLSLLAFAWNDDGGPIVAGHLPAEEVHTQFTTFGPRKLTWLSGANHVYQLQRSTNLADWLPQGNPISGTGFRQETVLDGSAAPVFFRLQVVTPAGDP